MEIAHHSPSRGVKDAYDYPHDTTIKETPNMETEVFIWALNIWYALMICVVLILLWYLYEQRNILFRRISFPDSFLENPYILLSKKESMAHLAFLKKVQACHDGYIEDYRTFKSGRKRYIEYILFLPGIDDPGKIDSLVPEYTEEEKHVALKFAENTTRVETIEKPPTACYRFRQCLSRSEYASADKTQEKNRGEKEFGTFVAISMFLLAYLFILNAACDAYCDWTSLSFAEELHAYVSVALIFFSLNYTLFYAGKISFAIQAVMAFAYTALFAVLNSFWNYLVNQCDNILVYDLKCVWLAVLIVFAVSFCCLLGEWKVLSMIKRKEDKEVQLRLQQIGQALEQDMLANWQDALRFALLWGNKEAREQIAEIVEEKAGKRQTLRTTGAEMLQCIQEISSPTLVIIEDVDELLRETDGQKLLFKIVYSVGTHEGKLILLSQYRPTDIDGLSDKTLYLLEHFWIESLR